MQPLRANQEQKNSFILFLNFWCEKYLDSTTQPKPRGFLFA